MIRRAIVGVALLGACGPAEAPATPLGQEAAAVCATPVQLEQVPHMTLYATFARAQEAAVFADMKRATGWYGESDVAEQLAMLRAVAAAAGVERCPLADELVQKVVEAGATAKDCDDLVSVIEAVATVSPEYVETVIAAGCSEIVGCARECVPGLASMAKVAPENRSRELARGCAAFRKDMSKGPGAFARARLAAFADACAPRFGSQAGRVAELRGQIGL